MAFKFVKGPTLIEFYEKAASQVLSVGDLMQFDGSGQIDRASATSDDNVGVCLKAVAATDDDYASTTRIPVEVPAGPNAVLEATVSTGTLATSSVGLYFDLTDHAGVDQSASANDAVLCVGFINSALGLFKLNSNAAWKPPVGGAS